MSYAKRRSGRTHGEVYTNLDLVHWMLDEAGYTADRDLSRTRITEPAIGEGAFAFEIIRRLLRSAERFRFDPATAINTQVRFYEISPEKISLCVSELQAIAPMASPEIFIQGDYLLSQPEEADIIIGNPPYIRYDQLPQEQRKRYAKRFACFRGRSDLYIAFFEHSLRHLAPRGKHIFVCSNRWMKSAYGVALRSFIAQQFTLTKILNLENSSPFDEQVLAYPSVTIIENKQKDRDSLDYQEVSQASILPLLPAEENHFERRPHPQGEDWTAIFHPVNSLKQSSEEFVPLEAMGFKIGIGVATGADKIFTGKHLPEHIEEELLLPLITSRDMRGDRLAWSGNYLINPFGEEGELIALHRYPKASDYFKQHQHLLKKRHIARKYPHKWYRTIDKVNPDLRSRPKILLPDISANNSILIDPGHFYPHHNLYYILGASYEDLACLSALLMSDFVRSQLESISVKMNGGFTRWQSQYLRKLRLPDLRLFSSEEKAILVARYLENDLAGINSEVNRWVGV